MKLEWTYCPDCGCGHVPGKHMASRKQPSIVVEDIRPKKPLRPLQVDMPKIPEIVQKDISVTKEDLEFGLGRVQDFVRRGQAAQKAVDDIVEGAPMEENVAVTPPKKAKAVPQPECPVCEERKRKQRERAERYWKKKLGLKP